MRVSLLAVASAIVSLSDGFAPSFRQARSIRTAIFSEESSSGASSDIPYEAGTQDELMYALGVNLARQLGDVRPLVENGQELAQVAKGLLDTVVGKLEDEGQRELLKRRGQELNTLIADRA